jgi:hypothetical protein
MRPTIILAALASAVSAPAAAEVVSAGANGFHLRQKIVVPGKADDAFSAFVKIENWWSAGHTYGGDSSLLSIEVTPGGCFCEQLANGGVEHMRVVHFDVPKRLVMTGGLGPLVYEAVAAVMDIRIEPSRTGSQVTMDYKVAGFASGGADKLAPLVDSVLAEQMKRYAAYASKR